MHTVSQRLHAFFIISYKKIWNLRHVLVCVHAHVCVMATTKHAHTKRLYENTHRHTHIHTLSQTHRGTLAEMHPKPGINKS